ncbi:GNAT family N-acetyltransferase [Pseudomonas kribbensis]|uniref:GNAT family N-acetyltransferase n=1 Tax=Pseudomonas kribbensis TaxID=1628086 RepID=UPI001F16FB19|nr:GNAT family N-acetyltransferase [Pseudomonas kribbensis]UIN53852.1 GNAT family N-acetyltransferase [Pseudomonas kribbensis]
MKIRRFSPGDEAALFRVFFSSIHQLAAVDYTQHQIDAWAPEDIDPQYWTTRMRTINPFVAEHNGEIVGYADIQSNGYIDHFFVSGAHARQGIGTLLMGRILDEANMLGIREVTSDVSRTAEIFFERHGFHVVERKLSVTRGVSLPNALMRKELK